MGKYEVSVMGLESYEVETNSEEEAIDCYDCQFWELGRNDGTCIHYINGDCPFNEENDNPSDILPTESGFFFGSTDYDEWYYEDISDTIKILEKVLAETDFENYQITYHSSW